MKRHFHHPEEKPTGRKYWRSMDELSDTPEFQARLKQEFPQGASEFEGGDLSRRSFMRLMGASVALAGLSLTSCRRPQIDIVAYSKGVEWQVPGQAQRFATVMPRRGGALPLLATSYNGRPTKLEGSSLVPGFNGTTDSFGQAAILDLYDPDRSKSFLTANDVGNDYAAITADDFDKEITKIRLKYQANQGAGLAFLAEPSSSPTRHRLVGELRKQFPNMLWIDYEPWSLQTQAVALGNRLPIYKFEAADVILSLDCDFLGASDGTSQSIAGFAKGRGRLGKAQEVMSRLYAVEGRFSLTGGMADHRLRLPSTWMGTFAVELLQKLGGEVTPGYVPLADPAVGPWLAGVANDLLSAKGRSLVVAGSQQPPMVHALVAQINELLGNAGNTVHYGSSFITDGAVSIKNLLAQVKSKAVDTLIILGGNPAFNGPCDLDVSKNLESVAQVIHHSLFVNETTASSTLHVPATHFLESWGDSSTVDQLYLTQQPLVLPLYQGVSELELLGALAGIPKPKGAELIQDTFAMISGLASDSGKPFQDAWHRTVHDGFFNPVAPNTTALLQNISASAFAPVQQTVTIDPGITRIAPPVMLPERYELNFVLGNIDDGRYANNSWLQELPDPVSRLTWENVLYVSPKTAKKFGVEVLPNNNQDLPNTDVAPDDVDPGIWPSIFKTNHTIPLVTVTLSGKPITLKNIPVLVAPGQHDQTLTLALGWGMKTPRLTDEAKKMPHEPLRVAAGAGVNAYALRPYDFNAFYPDVSIVKQAELTSLAISQEHNSMEGRGIVREATLDDYHKNPEFVQDVGSDKSIPQGELKGYQNYESAYTPPKLYSKDYEPDRPAWGMTIDLNTCVGCNACVVACQAENNIPVVGKWQVIRGREMHWIRIDRYFGTDVRDGEPKTSDYLEDPQMLFQPMACQQCENAPCEPVCPVNATIHNEEGLNVMAYNRCIGTRYCANNCPYKVRRFNFFNYNERPVQNVTMDILGQKAEVGELFLGPLAGKDGPLTAKGVPNSLALQKNPNVTVRIRGVIEKCTYCVQRIEDAKISQLRKSNETGEGSGDITLPTDGFMVACQQACPAQAIVFGNMNDDNSKVSQTKKDERNYGVLAYLGTRPRTSYLGRVRNPNQAMPGAEHIGHTSQYHDEVGGKI